jgi:hypothetical protein
MVMPIWFNGVLILYGRPTRLFDFLQLRPLPQQWATWIGLLTLFFFVLWFYENVYGRWRYRIYERLRRVHLFRF